MSRPGGSHIQSLFTEFFADNLGDFFIFLRRFADDILETCADSLEHVLHFVTVFMGDVERCVRPGAEPRVLLCRAGVPAVRTAAGWSPGKSRVLPAVAQHQALPGGHGLRTRHNWDLVSQYLFSCMMLISSSRSGAR